MLQWPDKATNQPAADNEEQDQHPKGLGVNSEGQVQREKHWKETG